MVTETKSRKSIHKRPKGYELYKEDVWGEYDEDTHEKISDGMIVAREDDKCPIFKDKVPFKSATIVLDTIKHFEYEVKYWCDYVQGNDSISKRKEFKDGRVALRSDYQCW